MTRTMTPAKTSTKKAAPKPKPDLTITAAKLEDWRNHARRLGRRTKPYDLDLSDIEQRLVEIEQQIPATPPVIRSSQNCDQHQAHLRKLAHLRTKVAQIQTRCIQSKAVWGHVIKIIKGFLWTQPEVAALKNDTARATVSQKVMGRLEWKYTLVSSLIEAADKVVWTLKDNQRAVLGMIQTATEERFLYREGMEK